MLLRSLLTVAISITSVIFADGVFRTSILQFLRPVVITPRSSMVLSPPIELAWDGPRRMQVSLSSSTTLPSDLGVHSSPYQIPESEFLRDGGYEIELSHPRFRNWVSTTQTFQVHTKTQKESVDRAKNEEELEDASLDIAIEALRRTRSRAHKRSHRIQRRQAALIDESTKLNTELDTLYQDRQADSAEAEELEAELFQVTEELRTLSRENEALRLRLASVVPCTVWGYYRQHPDPIRPVTTSGSPASAIPWLRSSALEKPVNHCGRTIKRQHRLVFVSGARGATSQRDDSSGASLVSHLSRSFSGFESDIEWYTRLLQDRSLYSLEIYLGLPSPSLQQSKSLAIEAGC